MKRKFPDFGWRQVAAVLTLALLASCGSSDPGVDAVVEELEDELSARVVPVLVEDGLGESAWAEFHEVLRDVRTEELHVVRGRDSGGSSSMEAEMLESVVTIVGREHGACLAVSVSSTGEVRSLQVRGHPAANCEGAQVPDWLS